MLYWDGSINSADFGFEVLVFFVCDMDVMDYITMSCIFRSERGILDKISNLHEQRVVYFSIYSVSLGLENSCPDFIRIISYVDNYLFSRYFVLYVNEDDDIILFFDIFLGIVRIEQKHTLVIF